MKLLTVSDTLSINPKHIVDVYFGRVSKLWDENQEIVIGFEISIHIKMIHGQVNTLKELKDIYEFLKYFGSQRLWSFISDEVTDVIESCEHIDLSLDTDLEILNQKF